MTFYPLPYQPPQSLKTAEFQLQPLHPKHLELDYDAVMASREMLNLWSGSSWPTPDFTLAENLADLKWHYDEHVQRKAFTYTILDQGGSYCLGCLYIRQLKELAKDNPGKIDHVSEQEALARFWLRTSHNAGNLNSQVLDTLINWFESSWHFPKIYFHTRQENKAQINLFQSSRLTFQFDLTLPNRDGLHQFYR